MIHHTPLGSHPEARDLTPLWVRRIFIVVLGGVLVASFHATDKLSNTLNGLFIIAIGGFPFIEAWYNRNNPSMYSKSFLVVSFGFVLFGVWMIFRSLQ